jgi:hypothetical protein
VRAALIFTAAVAPRGPSNMGHHNSRAVHALGRDQSNHNLDRAKAGAPRRRMLLSAHAQEAAEGHNCIHHMTADFLNHQTLYASDVVSLRITDRCALYPVTFDERFAGPCCSIAWS